MHMQNSSLCNECIIIEGLNVQAKVVKKRSEGECFKFREKVKGKLNNTIVLYTNLFIYDCLSKENV